MAAAAISSANGGRPLLIRLEHLSKRFGGVQALDSIRFDLYQGEILCLAGENGCGKSTLIKTISGVHKPDPGAVMEFDGESILGLDPARARTLGIQVIWQDLALFPEMTVAENIAFEQNLGTKPRLVNFKTIRKRSEDILDRLGVRISLDDKVKTLSIAQRQLVAIARALVADARLVFMDEPTASLSHGETEALLKIVRRLSSENIAVVLVSHRLAEVLDVCSRVTVLRDGKYVGTYPTEGMTQTRLTELMTGRTFANEVRKPATHIGRPVLSIRDLSRTGEYRNVSFDIAQGEVVGLTGRLGAGRTQLALTIFGMTQPDSGCMVMDGQPLILSSNREAIKAGIGYVSEDRLSLGLVQPQSIGDNIAVTVLDKLIDSVGLLSPARKTALADDWIGLLKVKIGHQRDPVSTLSGGNQQRIVLAKWLATKPKLLILDSPTVGVDVGARAGIFDVVRDLADKGMAILLISDEAPEVYFNADRILHMRDGEIIESFVPSKTTIDHIEVSVHA